MGYLGKCDGCLSWQNYYCQKNLKEKQNIDTKRVVLYAFHVVSKAEVM